MVIVCYTETNTWIETVSSTTYKNFHHTNRSKILFFFFQMMFAYIGYISHKFIFLFSYLFLFCFPIFLTHYEKNGGMITLANKMLIKNVRIHNTILGDWSAYVFEQSWPVTVICLKVANSLKSYILICDPLCFPLFIFLCYKLQVARFIH